MCLSVCIIVSIARKRAPVTQAFYFTVQLVIEELFNCVPGATSVGREQHMDGIAARLEAGIFGSVSGYLGVIEAQMRKMLHLHMLVQLHGFSHPDDIFRRGDLQARVTEVWRFVASICFRSTEAFARYLHEDSAHRALQQSALMPQNRKQRGMIGEAEAKLVVEAQLAARGLPSDGGGGGMRPEASPTPPLVPYMPQAYASPTVSSADYAAAVLLEVHAAVHSFGNHTCRSDVCHKGRGVGRLGFCRMMFWHWRTVRNKAGKLEAKRFHGLRRQKRWKGVGHPPIQPLPHLGAMALEVNHNWYMKLSPTIALGPRCNHDVSPLLRMPDLGLITEVGSESFPSADLAPLTIPRQLDRATEEAIDSTIEALIDHERYCGAYASKEEPTIAGAFFT